MELQDYRRQYTKGGLREASMPDDPMVLFEQWQRDASVAGLADPTGVVVATVQPDGSIRQRFVLLKGVSEDGFVFFTNYNSDKAAALAQNDRSSMLFPWNELDRQVSVSGAVERVSQTESDAYFASRPRDSQLGAWASSQSQMIDSRGTLLEQLAQVTARFGEGEIPRPPHWGGYRLVPDSWEFWQGGENRLHDRFRYIRKEGDEWRVMRLQP